MLSGSCGDRGQAGDRQAALDEAQYGAPLGFFDGFLVLAAGCVCGSFCDARQVILPGGVGFVAYLLDDQGDGFELSPEPG
ncbi:hypothetical protein [Streptomyces sp. CA-111067]|uniref:hypothetical protein n=1 Tax=Streptomyces sp. CA-111067 TaxID=3240046 RepID=UPI003D96859D